MEKQHYKQAAESRKPTKKTNSKQRVKKTTAERRSET